MINKVAISTTEKSNLNLATSITPKIFFTMKIWLADEIFVWCKFLFENSNYHNVSFAAHCSPTMKLKYFTSKEHIELLIYYKILDLERYRVILVSLLSHTLYFLVCNYIWISFKYFLDWCTILILINTCWKEAW